MSFKPRQIDHKFIAKEQSQGDRACVRHSLGSYKLHYHDPFLMLDEFKVGLSGGSIDYPDHGYEMVTYVLPTSTGHVLHEDFLGNKGELRPGDLQWMTPGRRNMHIDMLATQEAARGLQLWINLPKITKVTDPRYQKVNRGTVPHVFNEENNMRQFCLLVRRLARKGPVVTETPVTYINFVMQKGSKLDYALPENHNVFWLEMQQLEGRS